MGPANRFLLMLLIGGAAVVSSSERVQAGDGLRLEYNYIEDTNDRTFHDKSLRVDYKQAYVVGFLGNWQQGGEAGGYLKDSRRSAYSGYVRVREDDQSYQLRTEQILKAGFVGIVEGRFIHVDEVEKPEDKDDLFVFGTGFDWYYGAYNFFSVMTFNDPREGGRYSAVISNTLGDKNKHLRLGIVPRNDGTQGFFGLVRYHWLYAGYSFTREFDYTRYNRRVITLAVKFPMSL